VIFAFFTKTNSRNFEKPSRGLGEIAIPDSEILRYFKHLHLRVELADGLPLE
jgi:hypothetical protein